MAFVTSMAALELLHTGSGDDERSRTAESSGMDPVSWERAGDHGALFTGYGIFQRIPCTTGAEPSSPLCRTGCILLYIFDRPSGSGGAWPLAGGD